MTGTFRALLPSTHSYSATEGTRNGWSYNRKIQEPIVKNYLQEIDDDTLGSFARDFVFMSRTALNGPWAIDEFKPEATREEQGSGAWSAEASAESPIVQRCLRDACLGDAAVRE